MNLYTIIFAIITTLFIVVTLIKFDIANLIVYRFKNYFGQIPLCNMRPDRAFKIGDFVFPLCARCTGIVVGALVITIINFKYYKTYKYILLVSILLLFPMIIDGVMQYVFSVESTNLRRVITGFIFSIGMVNIIFYIFNKIMHFNNTQ